MYRLLLQAATLEGGEQNLSAAGWKEKEAAWIRSQKMGCIVLQQTVSVLVSRSEVAALYVLHQQQRQDLAQQHNTFFDAGLKPRSSGSASDAFILFAAQDD
jgi:hypothetical protein